MDGWNTFWDGPFSGAFAVSFRECSVQGAGCPCCICGAPNGCICGGATSSAMAGSGAAEAHKATKVDLRPWELLGGSSHLVTMVIVSPLRIGLFPFQMAIHGLQIGVTNYLLTGMILQVCTPEKFTNVDPKKEPSFFWRKCHLALSTNFQGICWFSGLRLSQWVFTRTESFEALAAFCKPNWLPKGYPPKIQGVKVNLYQTWKLWKELQPFKEFNPLAAKSPSFSPRFPQV